MSRLEGSLDAIQRERLGKALCTRVITAVRTAGAEPLIVTADPAVRAWGADSGVSVLNDPDRGLDEACRQGVGQTRGRAWLIVHSDLPLLVASEVTAMLREVVAGRSVIAPSSDGGTSAISAAQPIRFSFGEGSFHRHLPRLHDPVIEARLGWLHDLDDSADLASTLRHPKGQWLHGVLHPPSHQ
jgi:2-phospho-L-lactate guanylyltransferase